MNNANLPSGAADRVNAYLDQRATMRGIDKEVIHGMDGVDFELTVSDLRALAASAPVAPTQPESLHTFLNAAAAEGYVLNGVDAADLYVELFPERYVAALEWFHSGMHEASAETAPVAPAPQPAAPLTDTFVQTVPDKCDRIVWRNSYYHLPIAAPKAAPKYQDSTPQLNVGESSFEDWYQNYLPNSVGHKQIARDAYAGGMGDPLVMARPAPLQQGEYLPLPEPKQYIGVDDEADFNYFTANQMLAYVDSDRVARGAAQAAPQQDEYPETLYEGGRESVDDALAVVESFGPGVQGLNDTFARQVLLGQEVRRLRAAYEHACQGRSDFRNLYRAARGAVQPDPWHQAVLDACFQVESCYVEADPVKTVNSLIDWHVQNERRAAQAAPAPVAEDAEDAARWRTLRALTLDASAMCVVVNPRRDVKLGAYCPSHELLDALVDTIRAQAAQPEGGAKP